MVKFLDQSVKFPKGKIQPRLMRDVNDVNLKNDINREVHSSLCFPSTTDAYSACIQAMQDWFLDRLEAPDDYFKTIFIEGKNILDDYRSMNDKQKLKRLKPSLAINAQADLEYDNEKISAAIYGARVYNQKSHLSRAFFKDRARHMFMDVDVEILLMNFEFKVRVSTRAQQLDLYKIIQVAHRVGSTETVNLSMDFHVPYGLIVQVVKDAGLEVDENDEIVNVSEAVRYLNFNSVVPFLLKFRNVNGKYEFFVRVENVPMHIASTGLDHDDGERENQIDSNYIITLRCTTRFPMPKYYIYYSETRHTDLQRLENVGERIGLHTIKIAQIPEVNRFGWNLYLTTEIHEEDPEKPLVVDFSELITGDLREVMKATTDSCISCGTFMEIKMLTSDAELDYDVDWCNLVVKTHKPPIENVIYVGIYVDLAYLNDYIITSRNLASRRVYVSADYPDQDNQLNYQIGNEKD